MASFYLRVLEGLTPALERNSKDAFQVLESVFPPLFEVRVRPVRNTCFDLDSLITGVQSQSTGWGKT
jgi:hypothetical protein